MTSPRFKTTEVAELHKEVQQWCHPEFPFLDQRYSPGSNMPAIDFTPYITTWLQQRKESAIVELWTYLTYDSPETRLHVRNALTARLPDWITISDTARHELHAIYILTLRASWGRGPVPYVASSTAAMTLACRQLSLRPDYGSGGESMVEAARAGKPIILSRAYSQELLKVIRSELNNSPVPNPEGKEERARNALNQAMAPLGSAEQAAERLKAIPPMARRVIYNGFVHGADSAELRFGLFYDDRVYGCGAQANQQYTDWLGFFGTPNDNAPVPAAVTREKIRNGLEERGVESKKSATRDVLIDQARRIPGLISSLITAHCPEQRVLLPQWRESVTQWAFRVQCVEPVAAALINLLAASTMTRAH